MLAIVDFSAVSGYFLVLTLAAIIATTLSRLLIHYVISVVESGASSIEVATSKKDRVSELILRTIKPWQTPYLLALLMFTGIFTAFHKLDYFAIFTLLVFLILLLDTARITASFVRTKKAKKIRFMLIGPLAFCRNPRKHLYSVIDPNRPWGIVLIFAFVIIVAVARAEFVKNRHLFCIEYDTDRQSVERMCSTSIFLSAQNGIFVWDRDEVGALFIPWDSGVRVEAVGLRRNFFGRPLW